MLQRCKCVLHMMISVLLVGAADSAEAPGPIVQTDTTSTSTQSSFGVNIASGNDQGSVTLKDLPPSAQLQIAPTVDSSTSTPAVAGSTTKFDTSYQTPPEALQTAPTFSSPQQGQTAATTIALPPQTLGGQNPLTSSSANTTSTSTASTSTTTSSSSSASSSASGGQATEKQTTTNPSSTSTSTPSEKTNTSSSEGSSTEPAAPPQNPATNLLF